MKLHKALKLRKKLIGEISNLKSQIQQKNSFLQGSSVATKFNVTTIEEELMKKIGELINLKLIINGANGEIQDKIYSLSEYKALINFWNGVNVREGEQELSRFGGTDITKTYVAQIDEIARDQKVKEYQKKVDALQEEIDTYNYTTDVPWGDEIVE